MRFVSQYGKYKIVCWPSVVNEASGRYQSRGYVAAFEPFNFTEAERREVYERFGISMKRGSRMLEDRVTPSDQDWRIGTFDTADILDEKLRVAVEKALLESPAHGIDFVAVEKTPVAKPWPRYDELKAAGKRTNEDVAKLIVAKVRDLGLDVDGALAYERENANRPAVIAALESFTEEEEPVIEVAV